MTTEVAFLAVGSSVDLSTAELYYSSDIGRNWTLTATTTTAQFFYGVTIGTNGIAYMIGEKYKIFQASSDSGFSVLTTVFNPTASTLSLSSSSLKRYHFLAVCTIDGVSSIAVGNVGIIFYSKDTGSSWHASSSSATTADINALSCLSSTVAVASGANGYVAKTVNGGVTWTLLSVFSSSSFTSYGISIVNSNVIFVSGFILGDSTYQGSIYKSFDGGNTWKLDTDSLYNIYSLSMYSSVLGAAGVVANSPYSVYTRVAGIVIFSYLHLFSDYSCL